MSAARPGRVPSLFVSGRGHGVSVRAVLSVWSTGRRGTDGVHGPRRPLRWGSPTAVKGEPGHHHTAGGQGHASTDPIQLRLPMRCRQQNHVWQRRPRVSSPGAAGSGPETEEA